jgi:hypothetical protein
MRRLALVALVVLWAASVLEGSEVAGAADSISIRSEDVAGTWIGGACYRVGSITDLSPPVDVCGNDTGDLHPTAGAIRIGWEGGNAIVSLVRVPDGYLFADRGRPELMARPGETVTFRFAPIASEEGGVSDDAVLALFDRVASLEATVALQESTIAALRANALPPRDASMDPTGQGMAYVVNAATSFRLVCSIAQDTLGYFFILDCGRP